MSAGEDYVNKRKGLWEEIDGTAIQNVIRSKKDRDDYKKQSDDIASREKAIDETAHKHKTEVFRILQEYVNIAGEIEEEKRCQEPFSCQEGNGS